MRDWKRDYELQKKRGDTKGQPERQKARRMLDKTGADKNSNGKADKREGKDVDHKNGNPLDNRPENLRMRDRSAKRGDKSK